MTTPTVDTLERILAKEAEAVELRLEADALACAPLFFEGHYQRVDRLAKVRSLRQRAALADAVAGALRNELSEVNA